jgi:hypothetical protein
MALYKETSYDDWARRQRQSLQNSAQNLQQKQAGLEAAQNQKQKTTLESALSGLVGGLKERGSDIFNTAKNMAKYAVGRINQIGADKAIDKAQKDDSARRNEIAKKYGYNSYSEAANSGNASQDFWNEIKNNNKQTKEKIEQNNARQGSFGDVTKINTNEAKGQALNTIDSVLGLLPGGLGVAANIAGGGLSGIGDEYKRAGREGNDFNWQNAKNNAIVGAASGLAGSAGGAGMGKFASKAGTNALGKLAGTQLAKGIAGGAAAGAVGGGLGTYLNGGSLEDALLAAKEGAKAGGIGGGVMAGAMGLGGKALDKFRGRTGGTPVTDIEPVEATTVQKNRIDQPTAQRIEAEAPSTRRGIAITDLDAGAQEVNVRNGRPTENRGKYIDSVVRRADANLPEAQKPTLEQRFTRQFDSPLEQIIANGDMGDGIDILDTLKSSGVREPELAAIKSGARSYANDTNPFAAYGMTSRGDLPLLDRQEYYNDNMGKIGRAGNGGLTTEDVPSYMRDRLKNDAGKGRYSSADNESIMREVFGDNMSKEDMYRLYEDLADTTQASPYTSENFGYALSLDPELSARVQREMLEQAAPTRKISIESALTQAQPVDITDMTTNYRKSTIPARQYEQTVNNIPEAETTANRAAASAPEAQVMPQVESGKATGWGGKNMEGAGKKSNILQKAGKTLQETGQATKDNQVYSKLKGNFAEEMAQKQSVERLRELGFSPSEYKKAANDSEVINKFYDDSIKATKTPIEAPQVRNIAREVADDLHISSANRADLEKLVNGMLDDAVAKDGKITGLTMDRYTPADLEKVAKNLGQKAENITTTNYGGRKKNINNLTPENAEYARALGEVRNRLRNEIGEMTDYNEPELIARMKNAGMTQKQIDYVTQDHTLRGIKSRTSLFEDARNMDQQMRSDSLKRGANSSNSTNITTQIANESGASGLVKTIAQIPAQAIGTAEKAVGKALSWAGDKVAGIPTENAGETVGKAASAAKNLAGKAANLVNNATSKLNNESLANLSLGGYETLGNMAQNAANRQIGYGQARDAQERMANAQALSQAQSDYDNALASYQNEEQQVNNAIAQAQAMQNPLGRIEQAMTLALNAGDINAYSQLADLYQQAAKIEELKNPTSKTEGKALSANQAKALTAQQQLEMLATMKPNAGTVAANIPGINKIVNLTGGNEYDNQADALATTLGYLLSGANIKESEAKRIGKAYVPTAFDSEAVRQQKLDRAAQLIQSYMSDTGALAV